ncbi:hypothetical protein [Streptomyces sp. NPDC058653]|uniref:hypothetical protein n=1 Tax=Streptomyces sp. NPDC058653 TaxID=3346576 RepID=UPI003649B078
MAGTVAVAVVAVIALLATTHTVDGPTAAPGTGGGGVDVATSRTGEASASVKVTISAGSGCTYPDRGDRTTVLCTTYPPGDRASDLTSLVVGLNDGDDRLTMAPDSHAYTRIDGGPGDDILRGSGYDVFCGGAGAYGEGSARWSRRRGAHALR